MTIRVSLTSQPMRGASTGNADRLQSSVPQPSDVRSRFRQRRFDVAHVAGPSTSKVFSVTEFADRFAHPRGGLARRVDLGEYRPEVVEIAMQISVPVELADWVDVLAVGRTQANGPIGLEQPFTFSV